MEKLYTTTTIAINTESVRLETDIVEERHLILAESPKEAVEKLRSVLSKSLHPQHVVVVPGDHEVHLYSFYNEETRQL